MPVRRASTFLVLGIVLSAATAHGPAQELIDVLSYNIWVGGGNYPLQRTVDVINNSGADIIGLQEVGSSGPALASALGMHYQPLLGGGDVGVLSRYPISDAFGNGVEVTLPLGRKAYVFDTHLAPYPYQPYDIRDGSITTEAQAIAAAQAARGSQIATVMNEIAALVPDQSPLFFMGDFNEPSHLDWTIEAQQAGIHDMKVAWPTSQAVTNAGLVDAYRTHFPDEVARPGNTWTPVPGANEVHDRIDIVYHRGAQMQLLSAALVGEAGGPNVDIVGAAPYPSDHRAVLARYSIDDFFEPPIVPQTKGSVWTFAGGNLASEYGKGSLHYLNDGANTTQNQTQFGTTAGGSNPLPGIPDLPDGPDQIMRFPGVSGLDRGFRMNHNLPDTDGPTSGYLDSYTLVFDLFVADEPSGGYLGLINTNERQANAAEVWLDFASSDGGFWRQGSGGFAEDSFSLDAWHRVGLVVSESATLDIYVDGLLVANNVPWDAGDSLYTTSSPDPTFGGASFSLLGDGDGDHGLGYLANLAFFNAALSADEMDLLGGASREGIWLYLRGDANGDNAVTGADYTAWADSFGQFSGGANNSDGDFNGDGYVTGADYTVWADLYGSNLSGPAAASSIATATPRGPLLAPNRSTALLLDELRAPSARRSESYAGLGRRARSAAAVDEILSNWGYSQIPSKFAAFN